MYNFIQPQRPIAVSLPAGVGLKFQLDMQHLVDELTTNIETIFNSEPYQKSIKRIQSIFEKKEKFVWRNGNCKQNKIHFLCKKKNEKEKLCK